MHTFSHDQMRQYMIKGSTLYATGIQLQIDYELKCESPDATDEDRHALEKIREDNDKLYNVMKHFTRELGV